jgi:hypothetical protein
VYARVCERLRLYCVSKKKSNEVGLVKPIIIIVIAQTYYVLSFEGRFYPLAKEDWRFLPKLSHENVGLPMDSVMTGVSVTCHWFGPVITTGYRIV